MILDLLTTVFWGLVMFSLIVCVHEAGHFTAAKLCGMRVREFMLGLPGPNIGVTVGETKFGITPILLGGYALVAGMQFETESPTLAQSLTALAKLGKVDTQTALAYGSELGYDWESDLEQLVDWGTVRRSKLKGAGFLYEMNADRGLTRAEARVLDDADALIASERRRTYLGASYPKRVLMLVMGALFNLIFAVIVFTTAMVMVGDSRLTTTVSATTVGSPAAAAGILPGDRLAAIDGTEIATWEDFYKLIGNHGPGDTVVVAIERGGHLLEMTIVLSDNNGRAFLGVSPTVEDVPVGLLEAFNRSIGFIWMVAVAIVGLFNPATFGDVISQSSSVVGISVEASHAASAGFWPFIVLAAALSISIGLMNLLPLPPLDGGKILLESIQRVIRRPIPMRVINSISMVVLVLFGVLFLTVTWQDIQRYIVGG